MVPSARDVRGGRTARTEHVYDTTGVCRADARLSSATTSGGLNPTVALRSLLGGLGWRNLDRLPGP
jgi:hypothetical protein